MPFFKRRRFVSIVGPKSRVPDGLWMKCPSCGQAVYRAEVEENLWVCPSCGHHHRITARTRIQYLVDPESFRETHTNVDTLDPLEFTVGEVSYLDKVKKAKDKTGITEAIITGFASVEDVPTVLAVMDFFFMGGSMGSVVGEKFCRAADDAIRERLPIVVFSTAGGARMQEGILGLMQMAKTSNAVRALNEAGIPYISVLTDPTTGGVCASFASLGDIMIAEPNAEIGFAGKRLIEGALKVKIPEGFQTAEYQYQNGFLDQIVKRSDMRAFLGRLLRYLAPNRPVEQPVQ
ncbi:MAG: acetyl-CoA carboxylase carboxyltransferase subunit beta [Candidatus Hydrogenedentes bacterium]|nr:acetyl-CoA carboxylase carboxyltransferase subunit beta [Candidatus Hydrogenedentota bacterium]